MINNKSELKHFLNIEKKLYCNKYSFFEGVFEHEVEVVLWRYIKILRYTEFFHNQRGVINKLLYAVFRRKKNILGIKLGIEIWDNCFDEGLQIFHAGNIVVNGNSKIGKNCKLHGDNCIGNNGDEFNKAPIIGNNVDIGVGAKIIGDIYIADNIKIGAGAVVVKSCYKKGTTLIGVPAKENVR